MVGGTFKCFCYRTAGFISRVELVAGCWELITDWDSENKRTLLRRNIRRKKKRKKNSLQRVRESWMFEGDFRMKERKRRGLIFHFQENTRFNMRERERERGGGGWRRGEMRISDGWYGWFMLAEPEQKQKVDFVKEKVWQIEVWVLAPESWILNPRVWVLNSESWGLSPGVWVLKFWMKSTRWFQPSSYSLCRMLS